MAEVNEREDLDALLKSPGWLRFERQTREYWREQQARLLELAVSDRRDDDAVQKLREVMFAAKAINIALDWPKERLAAVNRIPTGERVSFSRGGYDPTTLK